MKKLLLLVILIAQSAYVTIAQNETLTFKEIGAHPEKIHRIGSKVYVIFPMTEYSINCGQKIPTQQLACDGNSMSSKHVVIINDTTYTPAEHVFAAYNRPGEFIRISEGVVLKPEPEKDDFGTNPPVLLTAPGIVYDKNNNQCIPVSQIRQRESVYEGANNWPFMGVVLLVMFTFASSLLFVVSYKNHKMFTTAKLVMFVLTILLIIIALVDSYFDVVMYEHAHLGFVWVGIGINILTFYIFHAFEKRGYEIGKAADKMVLISLFSYFLMHYGLVGVWEITKHFIIVISIMTFVLTFIFQIPKISKWYQEKYPDARFTRFMKV